MPSPLESARAKAQRAEETIQSLNAEIDAFLRANPNPYRIVGQLRNENREYVFAAFGELAIPIRFSVLVGEVMYQLRTSLDHLLSALVVANGGTPTYKHQFPICSTAARFAEAVERGDINGVSPAASDSIEQLQPYQPTQPTPPLLRLLRDWNNADKHRLLVVVGGAAALGRKVSIEDTDNAYSITGMTPPFVRKVTKEGADLFTIFLGEPHSRFRARAEFVPQVAIEDVGPLESASVSEVLTKMVAFIRHIFDIFARELNALSD